MPEIERTEAEWRQLLTPEQYSVLRQAGTERAWTGKYVDEHADGTYSCAACDAELFDASTKFESGSGWPSFYAAKSSDTVELISDSSHGMVRTEVSAVNVDHTWVTCSTTDRHPPACASA